VRGLRPIHVGTSPITNRIFAGHVLKCGVFWGEGKQDVTGAACGAVVEHVIANGEPVVVSVNGVPTYEISVRKIEDQPDNHLIAAAPDLLQELKNIANADTAEWDDPTEFEAWAKNRARAAIAKAAGEAQ